MNRDLWAVLVDKCETEALQKANSAGQGEGLWAYIRVHQWYNKTTELGRTNRLIGIMRPDACKHEYEIAGAVEKWGGGEIPTSNGRIWGRRIARKIQNDRTEMTTHRRNKETRRIEIRRPDNVFRPKSNHNEVCQ